MSEPGAFKRTDPGTSVQAALSVDATELEGIAAGLLDLVPEGLIGDEIYEMSGISVQTMSPRWAPLRRKGIIMNSGRKRKGKSGRSQIVWVLTKHYVTPEQFELLGGKLS